MSSIENTLPLTGAEQVSDSLSQEFDVSQTVDDEQLITDVALAISAQLDRSRRRSGSEPSPRVALSRLELTPEMSPEERARMAHRNMDIFETAVESVRQDRYWTRQSPIKAHMCVSEQAGERYLLVHQLIDTDLGVFQTYQVDEAGYPDKVEVDMVTTDSLNARIIGIIQASGELEL